MKKLFVIVAFLGLSFTSFAQGNKIDFFQSNILNTESQIAAAQDTVWKLSGLGYFGIGFGGATDAAAGVKTKPTFMGDVFIQVVGLKYQPAKFISFRTGIGFEDKWVRTSEKGTAWSLDNEVAGIIAEPAVDMKFSRLHIHSVYAPALLALSPVKGFKVTAGPEFHWNYKACASTKYTFAGKTYTEKAHDFKVERFSYDLYASVKFAGICVYVRYTPKDIFQEGYGPQFKYWSIGLVL